MIKMVYYESLRGDPEFTQVDFPRIFSDDMGK